MSKGKKGVTRDIRQDSANATAAEKAHLKGRRERPAAKRNREARERREGVR